MPRVIKSATRIVACAACPIGMPSVIKVRNGPRRPHKPYRLEALRRLDAPAVFGNEAMWPSPPVLSALTFALGEID
jgi:hypothetical protein